MALELAKTLPMPTKHFRENKRKWSVQTRWLRQIKKQEKQANNKQTNKNDVGLLQVIITINIIIGYFIYLFLVLIIHSTEQRERRNKTQVLVQAPAAFQQMDCPVNQVVALHLRNQVFLWVTVKV